MAFHPVNVLIGDVRARLRELPADSFDLACSSPPYWGLRDYGTAKWVGGEELCEHERINTTRTAWANSVKGPGNPGKNGESYANMTKVVGGECAKCGALKVDDQIGMEPTLVEHLAVMVDVCREVRRVLKPTGIFWLNYGDCYATSPNGRSAADTKALTDDDRTFRDKPFSTIGGVLKAKDLCMIPQRLAIALQEDGWYVRSLLPWVKRNGMPESISDRPATSIEYVIMLTKSARYFYNADAIRRSASPATNARVAQDVSAQDVSAQAGSARANGGRKTNGAMKAVVRRPKVAAAGSGIKSNESYEAVMSGAVLIDRNFRNTDLFFDSLTPPFGLIADPDGLPIAIDVNPQGFSEAHFATFPPKLIEPLIKAGCPEGGSVLDPFGGAGTTALVAWRLQRACTLIELNPKYAEITRARLQADQGMWGDVQVHQAVDNLHGLERTLSTPSVFGDGVA